MIEQTLREIYGWAEADRSAPTPFRYVDFLQKEIDKIKAEIELEDPGETKRNQLDEACMLSDEEMEVLYNQRIVTLLALKDYADMVMQSWLKEVGHG